MTTFPAPAPAPAPATPTPRRINRTPSPKFSSTIQEEHLLDQFEALVKQRRATRHFLADPVLPELLERLLRIAQWAPSAFNAQPTRFIVVTNPQLRPALRHVCMDQPQLEEAPVTVVFLGDRRAVDKNYKTIVQQDLAAKAMTPEYASTLLKNVNLMFGHGPGGLGWLWKAMLIPLARLFRPVPEFGAIHKRFWLAKQVMLNAMNFMLAAEAAGLNTIPMEGFDTPRLRQLLQIPRHLEPVLVVPVGYAVPTPATKTRLPLSQVISWR